MPMLEWSPEKRATAKDMLNHPWLNMEDNWDIKMTEKEINKLNLKNKINKLNLDSSDRSSSMSNEEMNELCESENELNNADIEDNSNDYETMSECSFTEDKEGKGEKGKQGSENDAMTNEQLAACDPVAFKYSLHSKLLNIDHGPNPQFQ
jgi:serine/threonine protein kinase